ncbi:MAG: hypothetical protein PHE49_04135 [bacterium]|nr:hypothetical protein [bacterium]
MGKCSGSAFGRISGPVGKLLFYYRNGQQIVCLKQDFVRPPEKQSIGFKNSHNILALLIRIYRLLSPEFHKYWDSYNKTVPRHTYFAGQSMSALYQSIPNKKQLISETNWFDMSQMQFVYKERLCEPKMKIENPTYNSNKLRLKWDTGVWRDGKPDDIAHIIAIYCVPSNKDIKGYDYFYSAQPDTPPTILNSILSDGGYELKVFYNKSIREQGETTMLIDENLNPKFLTVFLFFSNTTTYSRISSSQLFPAGLDY